MTQNPEVPLNQSAILAGLPAELSEQIGNIHVFAELTSTNEWLLERGACGDVWLPSGKREITAWWNTYQSEAVLSG